MCNKSIVMSKNAGKSIYGTYIEYYNNIQKQILISIKKNDLKQFNKLSSHNNFNNEDLLRFFTKNAKFFICHFMEETYDVERNKVMEKIFCILADMFASQILEIFNDKTLVNNKFRNYDDKSCMTPFNYLIANKQSYVVNTKLVSILDINYKYDEFVSYNEPTNSIALIIDNNFDLKYVLKIIDIFSNVHNFFTCAVFKQNTIKYNLAQYCVHCLSYNFIENNSQAKKFTKILCCIINTTKKKYFKNYLTNNIDYNKILYLSFCDDDLFGSVFDKKYTSIINPRYLNYSTRDYANDSLVTTALKFKKYDFVLFVIYHYEPKLYVNREFLNLLIDHIIDCDVGNIKKYKISKEQKETLLKISKNVIKNYMYLCPITIRDIYRIYKNNLMEYFYENNPEFIKSKANIIITKIFSQKTKTNADELTKIDQFYSLLNNDIEFPHDCFNSLCENNELLCATHLLSKHNENDPKIKKYANILKVQSFINSIIKNNQSNVDKYIDGYIDYVNCGGSVNKTCKNLIIFQNLSKRKKEKELNILLDKIKNRQYFIINSANNSRLELLYLFCKHDLSSNLIIKLVNKIGNDCHPGMYVDGCNPLLKSISNKNHKVVMHLLNTFGEKCYS